LPIKKIDKLKQKDFSELVDKILLIKKNNPSADTTEIENQIDQLVYQLYELTEEEITIVEGSTQ
jgi:adenine-specific DNA-methyltransferase